VATMPDLYARGSSCWFQTNACSSNPVLASMPSASELKSNPKANSVWCSQTCTSNRSFGVASMGPLTGRGPGILFSSSYVTWKSPPGGRPNRGLYTSEKQRTNRGGPFQLAYHGWIVPTENCGYFDVNLSLPLSSGWSSAYFCSTYSSMTQCSQV